MKTWSINLKLTNMKPLLYSTLFLLLLVSCEKERTPDKMGPIFYPTDMLFEDLKLDRLSFRIPDGDIKTGPATFKVTRNGTDWSGFAISNKNLRSFVAKESFLDSTKFSAYTGNITHAGGNFLVVKSNDEDAQVTFSKPLQVQQLLVAPTTFLYQAMMYGDSTLSAGKRVYTWAHGTRTLTTIKKDYVKVVIDGYNGNNHTGTVEHKLADRWSDSLRRSFTIADWYPVSLEKLGPVTRLVFNLKSTDTTTLGKMNTPPFFCIDGIRFKENIY